MNLIEYWGILRDFNEIDGFWGILRVLKDFKGLKGLFSNSKEFEWILVDVEGF